MAFLLCNGIFVEGKGASDATTATPARKTRCVGGGVCFQFGMKQAFVSIVSSYVGYGIASILRHHGYHVVGSIRSEGQEKFKLYE